MTLLMTNAYRIRYGHYYAIEERRRKFQGSIYGASYTDRHDDIGIQLLMDRHMCIMRNKQRQNSHTR